MQNEKTTASRNDRAINITNRYRNNIYNTKAGRALTRQVQQSIVGDRNDDGFKVVGEFRNKQFSRAAYTGTKSKAVGGQG